MKFINLNRENVGLANKLFTKTFQDNEILYRPFENDEAFFDFFECSYDGSIIKITILEEYGHGFASGCYILGEERAYLTFIAVEKESRRKGIGTSILKELEERLFKYEKVKQIEIIFFNPMTFSWLIPEVEGADHPNAPGIDVMSKAYLFYKNAGYRDYAMQNSYYISLFQYQVPLTMATKEEQLKKDGISFEFYQKELHGGIEELLKKLKNPIWERDILAEIEKKEGARPIIIVNYKGRVVGFAGPLDVEKSMRGYFAGIGVDSDYRGRGIAKVLFCKLCVGLKERGATFMTLFTGETNTARNIYEAAGFKIVKVWANMRKEHRENE